MDYLDGVELLPRRPHKGVWDVPLDDFASDPAGFQAALAEQDPDFIRVADAAITGSGGPIGVGRSDARLHALHKLLAGKGYFIWEGGDGVAKYIARGRIRSFWQPITSGEISMTKDGVLYQMILPEGGNALRRLVVVFSAIHSNYNEASLWRYFPHHYQHLRGLTPGDTAILRIGDLGGVVGSFYGDTLDAPGNATAVSSLIARVIRSLEIPPAQVCLLGSSKGATGAVRHGVALGLPFVAADPVLGDEYYERSRDDAHFTGPEGFTSTKDAVFAELLASERPTGARGVFLTSPQSPQHDMVVEYAERLKRPTLLFDSSDYRIADHPWVPGVVLGPTFMAVNALILGWSLPEGTIEL